MTYSFQKSLFTKWDAKTEVVEVKNPEFTYHKAFLPNSEMSSLQGHISTHSDVTGRIQQWSVNIPDDPNNVLTPESLIWLVEHTNGIELYPISSNLVLNNVGILRLGIYTDDFDDFPIDQDVKLYSSPPLQYGQAFNSGTLSRGGFTLLFRSDSKEPLDLEVYQRAIIFVHNN